MSITPEHFEKRVGHKPYQDDLDRSNCPLAGQIGHLMCGWDKERDLPVSIARATADTPNAD